MTSHHLKTKPCPAQVEPSCFKEQINTPLCPKSSCSVPSSTDLARASILLHVMYIVWSGNLSPLEYHSLTRFVYGLVSMSVGAIRRFLGSLISSLSLSLASLFAPATLPLVLLGVSGGVVIGMPVTLPELAAAIPGTLPEMRGGLLITPVGTVLD